MLTSATAIVPACIGFGVDDLIVKSRDLQHGLVTLAHVIGSHTVAALTFGDRDSARESLDALRNMESMETAAIYAGRPCAQHCHRAPEEAERAA